MLKAKGLLGSAVFSSGAKFLSRAIGLVSTLILARILTPYDFALIALIAIVLQLFDILSHTGAEQYIVQKLQVDEQDLNTAWSLDIVLKSGMLLLLLVLAPFVADFFEQPQLEFALQIASIALVINALKNPGLLLLKRTLDYKKVFYLSISQRLASFVVVIVMALTLRNFWAFIVADIVAALVFTLGAYFVHSYRPVFALHKVREQWMFSSWLMGKSIVGYLRSQIDTVLVAKFFNAGQLGNYHMARDVAMLPAHNLLGPAIEPLLADFKNYKQDPVALGGRVSKAICVIALLVIPITSYMAFYPALIVEVLLGVQWKLAGGLLGIMAFLFFYYVFLLVIESALIAIGKVKAIFMFDLFSLLVVVVSLWVFLTSSNNLEHMLWLRVAIGLLSTLLIGFALHLCVPLKIGRILAVIMFSIVLSLVSIGLSAWLYTLIDAHPIISFLVTGTVFCSAYIGLLIVFLPRLMGRSIQALVADFRA